VLIDPDVGLDFATALSPARDTPENRVEVTAFLGVNFLRIWAAAVEMLGRLGVAGVVCAPFTPVTD
jgi:hypothetical protein